MRVFRTILGMLALTTGLPTLLAGGGLWAVMQHRDPGGAFSGELERLSVPGYAVVVPDIDRLLRDDAPFARLEGTELRLTAITVDGTAFLGLAPSDEVAHYLAGVPYSRVDAVDIGTGALPVTTSRSGGRRAPTGPPAEQDFWTASGSGQLSLDAGDLGDRPYSLVLMNPGGGPVLRLAAVAEIRPGWLNTGTWGLLTLGTLLAMTGVIVLAWPGRRREVVYVVEPSQVPELMHAIGAPLPLPGGVAYFAGGRAGGAHRPRTLADSRPTRPPALPQFAWPPAGPAGGVPELPAGFEPAGSLSTATLTGTLPTDDHPAFPGSPVSAPVPGSVTGSPSGVPVLGSATGSPRGVIPGTAGTGRPGGRTVPGVPATGPLVGAAIPGGETSGGTPGGALDTTPGGLAPAGTSAPQMSTQMSAPHASATTLAGASALGTSTTGAPAAAAPPAPGTFANAGGPAGAQTPAPGRPLSLLGETPALTGLQPGPVPARRGERRHTPAVTDLPEFQATAVGAWVAATAPERARQTEARAAARLAEAARRNAGKFAPTQAGNRNMPGTSRIPIAAPRRDNGEATAHPHPAANPTGSVGTNLAGSVGTNSAGTTTAGSVGTTTAGGAGTTAAAQPAKGQAATPIQVPAETPVPGQPAKSAAPSTQQQAASPVEAAAQAAATAATTADTRTPKSGSRGRDEHAAPKPVETAEPKSAATADEKPAPALVGQYSDSAVPAETEPVVTRIALHTGPAATDWTATATTRLSRAPQQTAPASMRQRAVAVAAGQQEQAQVDGTGTEASAAVASPPEWPPVGEPAAEAEGPAAETVGVVEGVAGVVTDGNREGREVRASIHAVEAAIPVSGQSGPGGEQAVPEGERSTAIVDEPKRPSPGRPGPGRRPSGPGESRRSMHTVEAEGLKVLPKKPAPIPTQGIQATVQGDRVTPADEEVTPAGEEAVARRLTKPVVGEQDGESTTHDMAGASVVPGAGMLHSPKTATGDTAAATVMEAGEPSSEAVGSRVAESEAMSQVTEPEPVLEMEAMSRVAEPEPVSKTEPVPRVAEPAPGSETEPVSRVAGTEPKAVSALEAESRAVGSGGEGKSEGSGRTRKVAGAKTGNDHPLVRAQNRATGTAAPARSAPTARRAPAAWIKAAESMAARAGGQADGQTASAGGRAGGETAPAVPRKGRTTANPKPAAEIRPEGPAAEAAGDRPLSYREEAAELLAAAAGEGERKRRRTVAGRTRPKNESQGADFGGLKSEPQGADPDC